MRKIFQISLFAVSVLLSASCQPIRVDTDAFEASLALPTAVVATSDPSSHIATATLSFKIYTNHAIRIKRPIVSTFEFEDKYYDELLTPTSSTEGKKYLDITSKSREVRETDRESIAITVEDAVSGECKTLRGTFRLYTGFDWGFVDGSDTSPRKDLAYPTYVCARDTVNLTIFSTVQKMLLTDINEKFLLNNTEELFKVGKYYTFEPDPTASGLYFHTFVFKNVVFDGEVKTPTNFYMSFSDANNPTASKKREGAMTFNAAYVVGVLPTTTEEQKDTIPMVRQLNRNYKGRVAQAIWSTRGKLKVENCGFSRDAEGNPWELTSAGATDFPTSGSEITLTNTGETKVIDGITCKYHLDVSTYITGSMGNLSQLDVTYNARYNDPEDPQDTKLVHSQTDTKNYLCWSTDPTGCLIMYDGKPVTQDNPGWVDPQAVTVNEDSNFPQYNGDNPKKVLTFSFSKGSVPNGWRIRVSEDGSAFGEHTGRARIEVQRADGEWIWEGCGKTRSDQFYEYTFMDSTAINTAYFVYAKPATEAGKRNLTGTFRIVGLQPGNVKVEIMDNWEKKQYATTTTTFNVYVRHKACLVIDWAAWNTYKIYTGYGYNEQGWNNEISKWQNVPVAFGLSVEDYVNLRNVDEATYESHNYYRRVDNPNQFSVFYNSRANGVKVSSVVEMESNKGNAYVRRTMCGMCDDTRVEIKEKRYRTYQVNLCEYNSTIWAEGYWNYMPGMDDPSTFWFFPDLKSRTYSDELTPQTQKGITFIQSVPHESAWRTENDPDAVPNRQGLLDNTSPLYMLRESHTDKWMRNCDYGWELGEDWDFGKKQVTVTQVRMPSELYKYFQLNYLVDRSRLIINDGGGSYVTGAWYFSHYKLSRSEAEINTPSMHARYLDKHPSPVVILKHDHGQTEEYYTPKY